MQAEPTEATDPMPPFVYPGLSAAQCRAFETFAAMLATEGQRFNLTTILEPQAIYLRHFADSLQVLALLDEQQRPPPGTSGRPSLADIGSGAGLPGLALAIARPDWSVVCIEATGKKVAFQQRVIERLGLSNAQAMHGRAEELGRAPAFRETFDGVTARALAPLNVLVELALPLLVVGGRFVAYKGTDCDEEIDLARSALGQLGGHIDRVRDYTLGDLAAQVGCDPDSRGLSAGLGRRLIVIEKAVPTDPCFPRPWRRIKREPLGG